VAAQNTIDTVTVRGVSEGLDKVTADLNKVSDAHGRVAQASEEAAKVTDSSAKRQLSVANAFERVMAKNDPIFRAQRDMARDQAIIDRAFQQSAISANEYAAAMDRVRGRYGTLGVANNNLLSQTGNLAAQFNDIAVQLQSGTNPLTIAVQQGSQIAQVLGDAPGGARGAVRALGGAFMSLISPVNLATIGVIALGGMAIQYFMNAGKEAESLDDKLKRHAELIKNVKDAYGEAAKGVEEYGRKSGRVLEFQLKGQIATLNAELQRVARELERSVSTSVPAFTDPASGVGFGGADLQVRQEYQAFADVITRLQEEASRGEANFRAFQEAVEAIGRAAAEAGNNKVEKLAQELINATDGGLRLQGALDQARSAIDAIGNAASDNAKQIAKFDEAMRKLRNVAPIRLTDREQVDKYYQEMLSAADTDAGRQAAEQERREALDRIKRDEDLQAAEKKRREAEANARRGAASEDAFERSITTAQGRTRQIQEETRLYGQYGGELEAARLRIELETAAKKRGLDISDDMQRAIDAEVDARRTAVDQLERVREQQEALNQAQQYFGDLATDALSDLFIEGKNVEDVFNNVAKSIANAALQAALMGQGPLAGLLGLQGQNGAPGGLFGALFSGLKAAWPFANGGIMSEYGSLPLNKYASGGIARSPQVALFGEGRMPEAYVPLPDGRSIPVTMQGMSAPANNNRPEIHIHEAPGTKTTVKESDGPNGPRWEIQVEQLFGSMISEGRFDKHLKQRFGVSAMRGR